VEEFMSHKNKYEIRIGDLRQVLGYVNNQKPINLKNNIENYIAFICENIDDDVKITDIYDDLLIEYRNGRIIYCSGSFEFIKILSTHLQHFIHTDNTSCLKSEEYLVECEASQQTISNVIHLSQFGFYLATFVYERGYEPYRISMDSQMYKTEDMLKNDYPDAISYEEAYKKAVNNNWIEK